MVMAKITNEAIFEKVKLPIGYAEMLFEGIYDL